LDDPAAALAALEHDMAALMTEIDHAQEDVAPGGPPPQVRSWAVCAAWQAVTSAGLNTTYISGWTW
jgi:hypothetical protein